MSLVETVMTTAMERVNNIAETIEDELKTACPYRKGDARRSIHIERIGEATIRIGGTHEHLFFADQGNNQTYGYFGGKRNPKSPNYVHSGAMALKFTDGTIHRYAHTYEGKHFVRDVADRHR